MIRYAKWGRAALAIGASIPALLAQTTNIDWPYYSNDLGGMRYIDTDQITPANVSTLVPAWTFHTNVFNDSTSFEGQPIVVGGVVYISSPHDHVFALKADTGALMWTYNPEMPPLSKLAICCGQSNRGVAVGKGKVFIGQLDANLVALDAATGKMAWKVAVDKWEEKWTETMAPLYVDGKVIIGASGGEFLRRGHVSAYDADTGKMLWRFSTVPGTGEMGNNTWAGNSWKTGGATVWSTPTADTQLGLVYITTGNAAPDENGSSRAGDNLFANSIVALDLNTGQRKWHFQEVHHDLWDYDAAQPVHLFSLDRNGQQIPALGHANKNGFYFILDRRDGKPLVDVKETAVPTDPSWQHASPTQPVPATDVLIPHSVAITPPGMKSAPFWTPPQEQPLIIQPGFEAGPNYPPAAYSPRTKFAYIGAGGYEPWIYHSIPPQVNSLGSTGVDEIPGIDHYGLVDAMDTTTGKIAWQARLPERSATGVTVAGDLVFFGEGNGKFDAADSKTGKILWSYKSSQPGFGGANGNPAVYMVKGREFVIMPFGGNNQLRSNEQPAPPGDAIVAFALPLSGQTPAVVTASPVQVDTGAIPASAMSAPLSSPPADARVVELRTHDFSFHPDNFTVFTNEKIAVHIINTGEPPAGFAILSPKGPIALKGPVKPNEDAYFVFQAPPETGVYEFFSPLGPQKFFGMTGLIRVAEPCAGQTTPCISAAGITNSASFLAGAVAPGEIVTLFGVAIGPQQGVFLSNNSGAIGTTLAGTRVLFDGVAAPLLYSQNNQINAVVPFSVAGKQSTSVQVEYNGKTTAATTASVVDAAPGVFTMTGSGKGQVIAENADGSLNSQAKPAARGSIIKLYVTGLGQTDPPGVDGQFVSAPKGKPLLPIHVLIGGLDSEVSRTTVPAGLFAGLMEIQVKVPDQLPSGAASVAIAVGDLLSPATATVAIR